MDTIYYKYASSRKIPVLWMSGRWKKIKINWEKTPTPTPEVISREKIENNFFLPGVTRQGRFKRFFQKKNHAKQFSFYHSYF